MSEATQHEHPLDRLHAHGSRVVWFAPGVLESAVGFLQVDVEVRDMDRALKAMVDLMARPYPSSGDVRTWTPPECLAGFARVRVTSRPDVLTVAAECEHDTASATAIALPLRRAAGALSANAIDVRRTPGGEDELHPVGFRSTYGAGGRRRLRWEFRRGATWVVDAVSDMSPGAPVRAGLLALSAKGAELHASGTYATAQAAFDELTDALPPCRTIGRRPSSRLSNA